jgi:Meckel syndrome type 1 protein
MDSLAVMAAPPPPSAFHLSSPEGEAPGFASLLEQSQEARAPALAPPSVPASLDPPLWPPNWPLGLPMEVAPGLSQAETFLAAPETGVAKAAPLVTEPGPLDAMDDPSLTAQANAPAPALPPSLALPQPLASSAPPAQPDTPPAARHALTALAPPSALPPPPDPIHAASSPSSGTGYQPRVPTPRAAGEAAPGALPEPASAGLAPQPGFEPESPGLPTLPVPTPVASALVAPMALARGLPDAPPQVEGEGELLMAEPPLSDGLPAEASARATPSGAWAGGESVRVAAPPREALPGPNPGDALAGLGDAAMTGDATPIELPRAEASAPPPPPPPARQVAPVAIALAFAPQLGQFSVALDPPQLGRVEIAVQREGEGHQVRILAERPETLALLERDRGELDRALAEAGVAVGEGGVSFALAGDSGAGDQPSGERESEARRFVRAGPAGPTPGPIPASAPARGRLDLRI